MSQYLKDHPLGQPIPQSVHAVCINLPTMRDVIGYEEKQAETLSAVKYAYPRFLIHDYLKRISALAQARHGLEGRAVFSVYTMKAAQELIAWTGLEDVGLLEEAGFVLVHFPDSPEAWQAAKSFVQHTGTGISSRLAEDYLLARGELAHAQEETLFTGDAEAHVRAALRPYIASDKLWFCTGGMNALYAGVQAMRKVQAPRGRTVYLQLGWLYLDTMKLLKHFLGPDEEVVIIHDVHDWPAIEAVFAQHGDRLAGVVTELPNNPLVQTLDVERMSALCLKHGALRLFDPSIAGVVNVDVLPYADLLPVSLTKYAASRGDIMIGALAVNPDSPYAEELAEQVAMAAVAPYARDMARLAVEIDDMAAVAERVNANALALAEYLERSPKVKRVFSPLQVGSAEHFRKIARHENALGSIITFDLAMPLADFYDKSRMVKGPSFGTHFTLMCPFLYLAHYDLVSTPEGCQHLRQLGLNPELIRLSVGEEPLEAVIAALGI